MSRCPSLQQLEELLDETLDEATHGSISAHVAGCGACQAALERLTQDTLVAAGVLSSDRLRPPHPTLPADASASAFLDRLKQSVPGTSTAGSSARDLSSRSGRTAAAAHPPAVAGYEIVRELGRGGMGVVYLARQVGLNRLVALKVILAGTHAGPRDLARFRQEAEAVARLRHPNIIQIYDFGESGGVPFFVLELIEQGSLAPRLHGDPQPLLPAAALVENLARAVHFAHQNHVVHRDLKPANILLAPAEVVPPPADVPSGEVAVGQAPADVDYGLPKITDFGLAKRLDGKSAATQSGEVVGTPSYMAPEQAGGKAEQVGPAVDVYALGAILYEMLTGRPPFKAATALDTVLQVLHEEPVRPSRLRPQLPRDLETICLKCLQKEPSRRYASAEALADDLHSFRKGKPIQARPVGVPERAWKWARRRPVVAGLLLGLVVVGLLGFGGVTWQWQEAALARDTAVQEKRDAEAARADAEKERQNARASLYFSRIVQSQLQWRVNDVAGASQSLARCVPRPDQEDRRGWEWFYLRGLFHSDLLTMDQPHAGVGGAVAVHPEGRLIASVVGGHPADHEGGAGRVRIWDAGSGSLVLSRPIPGTFHRLAYSPHGNRLALAGTDGAVRVWEAATGKELLRLEPHTQAVTGLAFSPDGRTLATGSWDQTVKTWDSTTGEVAHVLDGPKDRVQGVAYSPDGRRLAAGFWDGSVKVWAARSGRDVNTLRGHKSAVSAVAFSPDSSLLASAGSNGNLKIWELETGRVIQSLTGPTGAVLAIAFSPDGRHLAYGGGDATARVLDIESGVELFVFRGHSGTVESLQFSPGGRRLVSFSPAQGSVKVWDLTQHPEYATFARTRDRGQKLVKVWDLTRRPEAPTLASTGPDVEALAFHQGSSQLVSVTVGGKLQVWDAAAGGLQEQRQVALTEDLVSPAVLAAFDPAGERLAGRAREDDRLVRVWEVATARETVALRGHTLPVFCVRFSSDGRYLVTCACDLKGGSRPHEVKVWEAATGRPLVMLTGHGHLFTAAFSPDGRWLALGGPDGTLFLADWAGSRNVLPFHGQRSDVAAVAFSPDGRLLASAGVEDRSVKVWDLAELDAVRKPVLRLAHTLAAPSSLCDLAFSPDGQRLAGISRDVVKMWDVGSGQEVLTLRGAPQRHWDPAFNPRVLFSPDGRRLVGTNWDESISLWEADPEADKEAVARRQASRRQAADARAASWHLQEAEDCWEHHNKAAARFHLQRLDGAPLPRLLQARQERLARELRD